MIWSAIENHKTLQGNNLKMRVTKLRAEICLYVMLMLRAEVIRKELCIL